MKFPSHECLMTFYNLTKYNDNPPPIRFYTNQWPFYRTRPFTELWEVSIEHLRRMWHVDKGRLLLWRLVPSNLRLAYVLLVETQFFFPNLSFFSRLCYSNIPRYFLDFAFFSMSWSNTAIMHQVNVTVDTSMRGDNSSTHGRSPNKSGKYSDSLIPKLMYWH